MTAQPAQPEFGPPQPPVKRRKRRLRIRLVATAIAVLSALLVAELALRFLFPQAATGFSARLFAVGEKGLAFLVPHAKGVHLTREFEVPIQANGRGYRDCEWPDPGSQQAPKVLFLGDSFVFGWGVRREDSFVARLQQDPRWVIYNAGIPGDGFPQYSARAELHVPEIRPALVVVCVYVNDFTQVLHPTPVEGKTAGKDEPLAYRVKKAVQALHLYRLAYRVGRENALISRLVGEAYHDQLTRDIFREEFGLYAKPPSLLDEVWPEAEHCLSKIEAICDRHSARLSVVYVTPSYLVDESVQRRLLDLTGLASSGMDFEAVGRRLKSFCDSAGAAFIDPRDFLADKIKTSGRVYFAIDLHFDAAGQRLMAEFLRGHLEKLLP